MPNAWQTIAAALILAAVAPARAAATLDASAEQHAATLADQLRSWRRDIHQHPELGEQETRTAALVAAHLASLGLEPRTGIAVTGVTAVLKGARPGPRIAIRADMDALPVTEQVDLPFASKATSTYRGEPVGVMHACGHDAHVAILLGVASTLAALREELPGEVMFVFQPAEEGPPIAGASFGAARMLAEGVFDDFRPDAVFGLHVWAPLNVGTLGVRSGPFMASADEWTLTVRGTQTHGSRPWGGVDPITVAAQILLGSQSIVARQVDVTRSPVVLTAGTIKGGVRFNIIPESVQMVGTLRSFDMDVREDVIARLRNTAEHVAAASGATAQLDVVNNAPVTRNDPALTAQLLPALQASVGAGKVVELPLSTVAEDFSQFANVAPGFYFFVGATPAGVDPDTAPNNHSPRFFLDEAALDVGARAMLAATLRFLEGEPR
ncbi:amidohydrolase [Chiayiivirga flava]|uniref:Amidohydrolase n=1 Tax=Chiayiivirga flava TaxID=659595 RepID=A0A7W8G0H5_9GAMM|nr:amidohydrolase [Chiayiivirga flava]MBB5209497.1 amidohydrolase [Chiayiivirga flava]